MTLWCANTANQSRVVVIVELATVGLGWRRGVGVQGPQWTSGPVQGLPEESSGFVMATWGVHDSAPYSRRNDKQQRTRKELCT